MTLDTHDDRQLECDWTACAAPSDQRFSEEVIQLLQGEDFIFVHPTTLQPFPNPEQRIKLDPSDHGGITHKSMINNVIHPRMPKQYGCDDLGRTAYDEIIFSKPLETRRSIQMDTAYWMRGVGFRVDLISPDIEAFDAIANDLAAIAMPLIPLLRPGGGFIDLAADNVPTPTEVKRLSPRKLTWIQHFGPALTDKLGRDFLLCAPVWQALDVGEHGVSLRVTERLSDWLTTPADALVGYFQTKLPKVKQYRAKHRTWD